MPPYASVQTGPDASGGGKVVNRSRQRALEMRRGAKGGRHRTVDKVSLPSYIPILMRVALSYEGGKWQRRLWRVLLGAGITAWMCSGAFGQKTLSWEDAKRELIATNPNLLASRVGIQESRADEITAYLRPNPDLTLSVDQLTPGPSAENPFRPLNETLPLIAGSYLVERRHKRTLRRDSARQSTAIAISDL